MGYIPAPPKIDKQKIIDAFELENKFMSEDVKQAIDEEIDNLLGFESNKRYDFGGTEGAKNVAVGVAGGAGGSASMSGTSEAEEILARIRGRNTQTLEGEERLEDQMDDWREKLSRWLKTNTSISRTDVSELNNQELIKLSQVLYNHTLDNGEFKKGADAAVIKAWLAVKRDRILDVLEKIEQNWKYRIQERTNGAGEVSFAPQRRNVWTLGFWNTDYYCGTIEMAIKKVEEWMNADLKDKVVIHGVAKKKTRHDGPPRRRPPPPSAWGSVVVPPPPPPPPPKRVIHEGIGIGIPDDFEPEMPEGPPNEIISDLGIGSYNSLGYDPRLDDPNRGTLTTEQEEENTVVELKKNLLD